jgi:uncharacterized membrane protein YczE
MFTKTDIEKYFSAEKSESLLFIVIGIVSIITAISFFIFIKTNFYKGAAIPLMVIGLLMGVVGFTVYNKSDTDRIQNVYAYDLNPAELRDKEIPRMKTVMKNFVIYKWVEIILFLVGIGLFFYFKDTTDKIFWKGFGITLAIMALTAGTADYFAAQRGAIYLKGLEVFIQQK